MRLNFSFWFNTCVPFCSEYLSLCPNSETSILENSILKNRIYTVYVIFYRNKKYICLKEYNLKELHCGVFSSLKADDYCIMNIIIARSLYFFDWQNFCPTSNRYRTSKMMMIIPQLWFTKNRIMPVYTECSTLANQYIVRKLKISLHWPFTPIDNCIPTL